MTSKLIFKMEMFKFFRDTTFLTMLIILGVCNSIFVLVFGELEGFSIFFGLVGLFVLILASIFIPFLYPFRAMAVDYKNNVMANMLASGVNRNNLFFAKGGAIFLNSLFIIAVIWLVPVLIVLSKLDFSLLRELQRVLDVSFIDMSLVVSILLSYLASYLAGLVVIMFFSILMKGSNLVILAYLGTSFIFSIITFIVANILNIDATSINGYNYVEIAFNILYMIIFSFASLKALEKQSL